MPVYINGRNVPKALVPFKVMNDCYPKTVVHVRPGNSRFQPEADPQIIELVGKLRPIVEIAIKTVAGIFLYFHEIFTCAKVI